MSEYEQNVEEKAANSIHIFHHGFKKCSFFELQMDGSMNGSQDESVNRLNYVIISHQQLESIEQALFENGQIQPRFFMIDGIPGSLQTGRANS